MCFGSDYPTPAENPAPPQAAKQPDTAPLKKRNQAQAGLAAPQGSSLLTGPSGISQSSLLIGQSSLLGGGTSKG